MDHCIFIHNLISHLWVLSSVSTVCLCVGAQCRSHMGRRRDIVITQQLFISANPILLFSPMFSRSLIRAATATAARPALATRMPQIARMPQLARFQSSIPRPDVEARVLGVFKNFLSSDEKLSDAASFQELGLDSLDAVEVMVAVEEEFGIEIPDKESEEIKSVKDAVDYISAQSAAR